MNTITIKNIFLKNIIKYIVQGIVVGIAAYILPNRKINMKEILIIACISALTFFILDIFTNDILSESAIIGVGVGIGERLLI